MADKIQRVRLETVNGNTLELFYNGETGLVVLDLANDKGGNELYRRNLEESAMLEHTDDTPEDEAEDEPTEGDYIISDGRRGGEDVSELGGKHLGHFTERDAAELFIRRRGNLEGFFPNVWVLSDHGNYHRIDFKWD